MLLSCAACGGAAAGDGATDEAADDSAGSGGEQAIWERPGLEAAVRPEMGPPQHGDDAPDFELPISGGGAFRLADSRGSWVVLHFTATWCPFCDAEVEHLSRFADDYESRGVKVLLVDVKEESDVWSAYAGEHVSSDALILLEDQSGEVAAAYAPREAQPSFDDRSQVVLAATVLIDPEGTIRLFLLADSARFDPTFAAVRTELDRMMGEEEGTTADGPTALLAPQDVVQVTMPAVPSMAPGESGELEVHLDIADGYHVMSDQPSRPNYIATEVTFADAPGIEWGETAYPPPTPFRLGDSTIRTFEGEVVLGVPVRVSADAEPGPRELDGEIRYQACTTGSCLFPITIPIRAALTVG